MEVKKRRGRPPKPRQSILSAEQVLAIRGGAQPTVESAEDAAARRAKDAERKRVERQQVKAEKEVESIETYEQLWEHNRKNLTQQTLDALWEQQEKVFDQLHWVNAMLDGTYDVSPADTECYVSLEEGAADVAAFVKTHGLANLEIILLGQYWKTPLYQERFQGSDPDSIFARLGLVVALPAHKFHQWEQSVMSATPVATTTSSGNGFTTMKCACNSPASVKSVPDGIAAAYRAQGKKYVCFQCQQAEKRSKEQSSLYTGR
jgi:hypothetical protein